MNSKNNKNLIIIGSGSHSRVVFDVACSMGEFENFFFFDLNIEVDRKINGLEGVGKVSVDLVWEPMWNRDMMSEEAQLELGMM